MCVLAEGKEVSNRRQKNTPGLPAGSVAFGIVFFSGALPLVHEYFGCMAVDIDYIEAGGNCEGGHHAA